MGRMDVFVMSQNKIYLSPPHMNGYELEYVKEAFESNWIAPLGPHVDAFEKEIADFTGVKYAAALSSGTAGIHLALKYLGVGQGDSVFCSSLTFAGTCNPILYEKAVPVFIDSEPGSWNMSPDALEKAFDRAKMDGKMPMAVIAVNIYGQSADWDKILPICNYYNIPVIEDAAESLGATYKKSQTGSFGYIGVLSFNGNKIITTSGGGMVVSDDRDAVNKILFWATQSKEPARHYEHKEIGYNYRMSNICAAIGRGQLKTLTEKITKRKSIYNMYKKCFADIPVEMMPVMPTGAPNYWLSVMTLNKGCPVSPENIITALEKENIESRPLWKPMHKQPVFEKYPFFPHSDSCCVSEDIFERGICLPSGCAMTESELEQVIAVVEQQFLH